MKTRGNKIEIYLYGHGRLSQSEEGECMWTNDKDGSEAQMTPVLPSWRGEFLQKHFKRF